MLDPRRDAEVPATAAEAPEELRVLVGSGAHERPVRRDELGADKVVAGEAVLRRQMPDAAAEGEAGHAGRADDAARRDEAGGLRGRVEVEPGGAALGACDPRSGVHLDRPHRGEVDHEAAVEDAVPGRVVAAAAHCNLESLCTREVERGRDVAGAEATHDDAGPAVDERVEAPACRVVPGVVGCDDLAAKRQPQVVQARPGRAPSRTPPATLLAVPDCNRRHESYVGYGVARTACATDGAV